MVDLTVTPANVVPGAKAVNRETGVAGETILAGQTIYKGTDGKLMKADSNSAVALANTAIGISLHGASLNQPLTILKTGDITIGATLVAGTDYYLSDTPGGICPRADVGSGENVCLIGLAKSTTVLAINIQTPGVVL